MISSRQIQRFVADKLEEFLAVEKYQVIYGENSEENMDWKARLQNIANIIHMTGNDVRRNCHVYPTADLAWHGKILSQLGRLFTWQLFFRGLNQDSPCKLAVRFHSCVMVFTVFPVRTMMLHLHARLLHFRPSKHERAKRISMYEMCFHWRFFSYVAPIQKMLDFLRHLCDTLCRCAERKVFVRSRLFCHTYFLSWKLQCCLCLLQVRM